MLSRPPHSPLLDRPVASGAAHSGLEPPSPYTRPVSSIVQAGRSPDAPRPARRRLAPGAGWLLGCGVVLGLAGAVTLMCAALAVGMRLSDSEISGSRATATATVLSISPLRTGIEFVDGGGVTIRPPDGVLYPGLLSVGQRFLVEYSTATPTVVRVAGRTASVGNVSLALTLATTWVISIAAYWWCRRRRRRRRRSRSRPAGQPVPTSEISWPA